MANKEQLAILHQGSEVWNTYRKENPNIEIDLSNIEIGTGLIERLPEFRKFNFVNVNLEGASLRCLNLSHSDFSNSKLENANFDFSDLSFTNFSCASGRNISFYDSTFLESRFTCARFDRPSFNCASIEKCNFKGSQLLAADFCNTKIALSNFTFSNLLESKFNYANCEKCYFNDANLRVTSFLNASLNHTCLTGAVIEDWNINDKTSFIDVECDLIYRSYDLKKNQFLDRLPINPEDTFKPREFQEWITVRASAQSTIDLTFREGIEWQSFFQSLQEVREQYPETEVGLQAIEKKGAAFVIRLETSPEADRSVIEAKTKELYETQLKLSEAHGQVIAYKNVIESMVIKMAEESNVTQNFNAPVGNVAGSNEGEMKAVQHNYAGEIRQTPAESAKEIQDLLLQLQQTNPTDIQSLVEQKVKSDPSLRQRIKNALKEGGLETMKVIFPLTGIAIETVRGWVEAEGE